MPANTALADKLNHKAEGALQKKCQELVFDAFSDGIPIVFTASGDSMFPLIRGGDCLSVARVSPKDVGFGDIVLARFDTTTIVHRVLGMTNKECKVFLTTKGDFCLHQDHEIPWEKVVGKVTSVEGRGLYTPFWRSLSRSVAVLSLAQALLYNVLRSNPFYGVYQRTDERFRQAIIFPSKILSNPLILFCWILRLGR